MLMTFKSSFFRYMNAMVVSEIGAKLIDLGGVECRCRESVGGYVRSMRSLARWSMRDGEVGEYFNYIIIGEVRYTDPSGAVRDGLVCLSPCLCDAIRRLVSEEPELARYLAIAVTPLRRVYDLTRREDLLELRALAVNICRAAGHEAVLSRDVIADFTKHYIMRRAGEDEAFRSKVVDWLMHGRSAPYGLITGFLEHLRRLGVKISEKSARYGIYHLFLTSRTELLNALGVRVKGRDVKVHCPDPESVISLLRELDLIGVNEAWRHLEALCGLSGREAEALLRFVRGSEEFRELVRARLREGVGVDELRRLISENQAP